MGFLANFKFVFKHEQVKESKRLVKCFLNYLKHDKGEVNVLFEMLSIFLVRTRIDYTFLKEFFMVEVRNFCNLHLIYFYIFIALNYVLHFCGSLHCLEDTKFSWPK